MKVLLFSGESSSADLLLHANARGYEFEILAKPVHPVDLLMKLQNAGGARCLEKTQSAQQRWIDIAPIDPQRAGISASSKDN